MKSISVRTGGWLHEWVCDGELVCVCVCVCVRVCVCVCEGGGRNGLFRVRVILPLGGRVYSVAHAIVHPVDPVSVKTKKKQKQNKTTNLFSIMYRLALWLTKPQTCFQRPS